MSAATTLLAAAVLAHNNPRFTAHDALAWTGGEYGDFVAADSVMFSLYGNDHSTYHGDPVMALLFASVAATHGRFMRTVEI